MGSQRGGAWAVIPVLPMTGILYLVLPINVSEVALPMSP
jgi:hypothetical protein